MRKVYIFEKVQQLKRSNTIIKPTQPQKNSVNYYQYYIGQGNNPFLVRRILSTRKNWQQSPSISRSILNFKWQQTDKYYKYDSCVQNKHLKHSLNHFEYHQELSNKDNLFRNILEYCETQKINAFQFVPVTFILNTLDNNFETQQHNFISFYYYHQIQKQAKSKILTKLPLKRRPKTLNKLTDKKIVTPQYSKYQIYQPYIAQKSQYLWILKPTSYNRGNGVHVITNLYQVASIMDNYLYGSSERSVSITNHSGILPKNTPTIKQNGIIIKSTSFVIQKYMQKPLLWQGRKFDIRMWVLVTHELKVYLFKQGYMRLSSYAYAAQSDNPFDPSVHLTNNAVQKYSQDYNKFQLGNQLSFKHLRQLVQKNGKDFSILIQQIKDIVKISALSVRRKLNRLDRNYCFEIFGYDFMVDCNCKPWLIQVNTNPCIEESSPILQQLLPRMLDDAFCLTLDQMFETTKTTYAYVVENEPNTQNLWQPIVDLKNY